MEDNRIKVIVLNNFIGFEKKIYQIFGFKTVRPISFKLAIYAGVFGIIEAIIYFTPFINVLISWMPFVFLVALPIGLAWLLNDVGTEDRKPLNFFQSFFKYHLRKIVGNTYFRGREVQKMQEYSFGVYFTYTDDEIKINDEEMKNREIAREKMEKANRYLHRIHDVDSYIKEQKRLKEEAEKERENNK